MSTANRTNSIITTLSLALFLLTGPAPAAHSAQESVLNARPFQLKAVVDEMPQLSRDGLDQGLGKSSAKGKNGTAGDEPLAALPLTGSVEELGEFPGGTSVPPSSRQDHEASPPAGGGRGSQMQDTPTQQQQQADEPNGSMLEYGVDWATWVSKLADRWFFALKKMEDQSGLQFHTVRPALIHFTCYPNGQISNVYLKQSCGIPLYDQMQVQALGQILPVHKFPKGTKRDHFTLVQGWEAHPRRPGEEDFQPGSFGHDTPMEVVKQWMNLR